MNYIPVSYPVKVHMVKDVIFLFDEAIIISHQMNKKPVQMIFRGYKILIDTIKL